MCAKISVADPDPGSSAFLTPGSGKGKETVSGSGMNNSGSYFRELRNQFFWVKILELLTRIWDPGSGMEKFRIRDGKNSDLGIGIWDKHHESATLAKSSL